MTEARKDERRKAKAEAAGTCKHCQKPAYKTAEGKLRHDSRAVETPPAEVVQQLRQDEDKKPERPHFLHRKLGGTS